MGKAENRVEWMIADLACFAHSLVSIPLSASNEEDLEQLIEHSQIEVLVCSRRWTLRVLKRLARGSCRKLKLIIQVCRVLSVPSSTPVIISADPMMEWLSGPWLFLSLASFQMERLQYEEIEAAAQVSADLSNPPVPPLGILPNTLALHDFNYVEQKGQRHPISRPRRPLSSDIATVTYPPRTGRSTEPLKG